MNKQVVQSTNLKLTSHLPKIPHIQTQHNIWAQSSFIRLLGFLNTKRTNLYIFNGRFIH